jgi:hypothetical protein
MRQRSGAAAPLPPEPFGQSCTFAVRNTVIFTQLTGAYVTALTLNTGVVPAGDYRISTRAYYSQSAAADGDCQLQLMQDGLEILNKLGNTNGSGIAYDTNKNMWSDARVVTLTEAAHTFLLRFRVGAPSAPGDEAAIYWARMNFWSFN